MNVFWFVVEPASFLGLSLAVSQNLFRENLVKHSSYQTEKYIMCAFNVQTVPGIKSNKRLIINDSRKRICMTCL